MSRMPTGRAAGLPLLSYGLLAAYLLAMAARSHSETTLLLVASSLAMFACCWASASHLLGPPAALRFVALGLLLGWFAEQMGASRGWFFGSYTYTEVLGPRLGQVPLVIPLMWFALAYSGYAIANLIVCRVPVDASSRLSDAVLQSLLAALIVTAYDLGADPYMVRVVRAWTMAKTDGWWFGETVQGFFGWAGVCFAIVFAFRLTCRRWPASPPPVAALHHGLVPLGVYGGSMVFQMAAGEPPETRSIAALAMGIPLLCAGLGWRQGRREAATGGGRQ